MRNKSIHPSTPIFLIITLPFILLPISSFCGALLGYKAAEYFSSVSLDAIDNMRMLFSFDVALFKIFYIAFTLFLCITIPIALFLRILRKNSLKILPLPSSISDVLIRIFIPSAVAFLIGFTCSLVDLFLILMKLFSYSN